MAAEHGRPAWPPRSPSAIRPRPPPPLAPDSAASGPARHPAAPAAPAAPVSRGPWPWRRTGPHRNTRSPGIGPQSTPSSAIPGATRNTTSKHHAVKHHHARKHRARRHQGRLHGNPWQIAGSLMPAYHWTSWQFHYLNLLWMRESGWNRFAYNHSSGAYGIPQAVPGDKMAAAGPDWRTSARTQIIWGMGYIQVTLRRSVECVAARVAVWLVLTAFLRTGTSGTAPSRPAGARPGPRTAVRCGRTRQRPASLSATRGRRGRRPGAG